MSLEKSLIGIDGERVYALESHAQRVHARIDAWNKGQELAGIKVIVPVETVRYLPGFAPLQGLLSFLYDNGSYSQIGVTDEWWDRLWAAASQEGQDYWIEAVKIHRGVIEDKSSFMLHEAPDNYTSRYDQPFWSTTMGSPLDRGYRRVKIRVREDPARMEEFPSVEDLNHEMLSRACKTGMGNILLNYDNYKITEEGK